jgi:hypothetical protein
VILSAPRSRSVEMRKSRRPASVGIPRQDGKVWQSPPVVLLTDVVSQSKRYKARK